MSLGWLTESSLMPKRPKEIDDVGKASMFGLRAALYQQEEAVAQKDGSVAAAALADERRRRERRVEARAGGLGGVGAAAQNRGVHERNASDLAEEADEEARVAESLKRKAAAYDAMMRGDAPHDAQNSLVDFELKHLTGQGAPSAGAPEVPSLVSSDMVAAAKRTVWEAEAREEMADGVGRPVKLQRYEQRATDTEKAMLDEVTRETVAGRASASEQRTKRQRGLDDRRALLRLKQEARLRVQREPEPPQPEAARPQPHPQQSHASATTASPMPPTLTSMPPPIPDGDGGEAAMMAAMGLPGGFTSTDYEQAVAAHEEEKSRAEYDARVAAIHAHAQQQQQEWAAWHAQQSCHGAWPETQNNAPPPW